MSFFDLIGAVTSAFSTFTSSVSDYINETINTITNTGQGLFAGIIQGLYTLGSWIYNALSSFGNLIAQGLNTLGNWLAQGLAWIRNGLIQLGAYIYNALVSVWNWLVNQINNFIKWIWDILSPYIQSLNNYFNTIVNQFWQKFPKLLAFNFTYSLINKQMEKIVKEPNVKNILGLFVAPVSAFLGASIISSFVTKQPQYINLLPTPQYTEPQITQVSEKTAEEVEVPKTLTLSALVLKNYITNISSKVTILNTYNVLYNTVSVSSSVNVTYVYS